MTTPTKRYRPWYKLGGDTGVPAVVDLENSYEPGGDFSAVTPSHAAELCGLPPWERPEGEVPPPETRPLHVGDLLEDIASQQWLALDPAGLWVRVQTSQQWRDSRR